MRVLSRELMLEIESAEIACWISYLSGVKNIPNNPLGVEISSIGQTTAFLVKNSSSIFFNKALGFNSEYIEYIDPLMEFFHSNDKMCTVEIVPLPENNDLYLVIYYNER